MFGFDALGRLALGEIPQGAQNVTLIAASGAYVVTGNAAWGAAWLVAQPGSYIVTGYPVGLAGKADQGSYVLTGNVIAFRSGFIAGAGSYALTGNAATFAPVKAAASGQYAITGNDAGQRFATGSGFYTYAGALRVVYSGGHGLLGFGALGGDSLGYTGDPIISDATNFAINFVAAGGSYALTLGEYELRRTGYDYPPVQYGIGHIKLVMEEARRLSRVVKPTPYPIVARYPSLAPPAAPVHTPLPVGGLIDNNDLLDHLFEQRRHEAAQQAEKAKQQARNRAMAVLLLAA